MKNIFGDNHGLDEKSVDFITKALETAITNVKEKKIFESGFKPEPLKDNEFYVVFDLFLEKKEPKLKSKSSQSTPTVLF